MPLDAVPTSRHAVCRNAIQQESSRRVIYRQVPFSVSFLAHRCRDHGNRMVRRISERVIGVGIAAIAAIIVAGFITYTRLQLLSDAAGWVSRTERVRYALQRTLSTVQDAESAVRGYLITHEDPFLEPYTRAHADLDSNLLALTALLADSPARLTRARQLDRLARARLDSLNTAVTAIRDGTFV